MWQVHEELRCYRPQYLHQWCMNFEAHCWNLDTAGRPHSQSSLHACLLPTYRNYSSVLCCAVPCCAVLCSLCYPVLCHAVILCCPALCCAALCSAVLCCAVPCHFAALAKGPANSPQPQWYHNTIAPHTQGIVCQYYTSRPDMGSAAAASQN